MPRGASRSPGSDASRPTGTAGRRSRRALAAGGSGIGRISLFDPEGLPATIAGEIKDFDPPPHVDAKDVRHVSRAVPLAIAASAEALADAGIEPSALSLWTSAASSACCSEPAAAPIEFSERMYHLYYTNQVKKASVYAIASGTIGTLSSEISMRFGLRGPSHVISTGCASSTDALGLRLSLDQVRDRRRRARGRRRRDRRARHHGGLRHDAGRLDGARARARSAPRAPSRADRDGFVLGEGAWMFVLEERERARARGARVYAEIRGYGATCDAHHRVRLDETGEEPARAMTLALARGRASARGDRATSRTTAPRPS